MLALDLPPATEQDSHTMRFHHLRDILTCSTYERVHDGEVEEELFCEHSPSNGASKCCEKRVLRAQRNVAFESSNRMVFVILATLLVSNAFGVLAYFLKAPSDAQCVQNLSLWCKKNAPYFCRSKQADLVKHR